MPVTSSNIHENVAGTLPTAELISRIVREELERAERLRTEAKEAEALEARLGQYHDSVALLKARALRESDRVGKRTPPPLPEHYVTVGKAKDGVDPGDAFPHAMEFVARYERSKATDADLVNRFAHHAPCGDQAARYEKVRALLLQVAREIVDLTPACSEQYAAVEKLEGAMFLANAAIARHTV